MYSTLTYEILSHTCVRQGNSLWLYYIGNKGCYVINGCYRRQKPISMRKLSNEIPVFLLHFDIHTNPCPAVLYQGSLMLESTARSACKYIHSDLALRFLLLYRKFPLTKLHIRTFTLLKCFV